MMVFLKDFFEKIYFEKIQQTAKKHAKLPSIQRVKVLSQLSSSVKVESKSVWHHQCVVRDSSVVAVVCGNSVVTPTKLSNAQHLVEYEKQLLYEVNKKSGNIMQQPIG